MSKFSMLVLLLAATLPAAEPLTSEEKLSVASSTIKLQAAESQWLGAMIRLDQLRKAKDEAAARYEELVTGL